MATHTDWLPDDVNLLQRLLQESEAAIEERDVELAKLRQENADLRHNVEVYRKLAFGPSSERRRPEKPEHAGQQHMFGEELVAEAQRVAAEKGVQGTIEITPPKPRKKGGRRSEFPSHLPHVKSRYELKEHERTCSCGGALHEISCESSKELERLEVSLVHVIERAKYACRKCESGVTTASGPDRPFERGLLGLGFLAHVFTERFGNHMPYHRLEKKYQREGLSLSRSVLERSMARCAERLKPLYEILCKQVFAESVLFHDDTPVTIARPSDRPSGSKQGRIWIYLDRKGRHLYDFTESREGRHPRARLATFKGFIHADAFPGIDRVFLSDDVTEVACWAHTRRRFLDAEKTEPELAAEILSRIRQLYAIERAAKEKGLTEEGIHALRQEKAMPILEVLRARLAVLETQVLPKSPMGNAVGYAMRQWDALCAYVTDGRLEIDNNAAERALRDYAVGRKGWLFFQREGGGEVSAILMSLLKTAIAAGIDPHVWFRDVLVRIDKERDTAKLLPHAWKEHFADEVEGGRQQALQLLLGS